MLAIRALLFLLLQLVTVIPWAFVCLACAPLPLADPLPGHDVMWPRAMTHALRLICGVRWEVRGAENLPDEPVLLMPKHQSTWETFFLIWAMPRHLCFVFKRELLYVPFFGWGMALLDMIHIDRSRSRDAFDSVVRQGVEQLANGRWVIMFPEGTRTPAGSQGKYKSGGARLAIRTGTPVVPIAINAGRLWPKKNSSSRPGLITVSIGLPIPTTDKSPEHLTSEVETWIEAEMRRISPGDYGNLPDSTTERGEAVSERIPGLRHEVPMKRPTPPVSPDSPAAFADRRPSRPDHHPAAHHRPCRSSTRCAGRPARPSASRSTSAA